MATVVRPTIRQAIRSVFAQRFSGQIQILVGIDKLQGERALLDGLIAECPSHVAITVMDLGYSTSQRHGGLYPSHYGGALKTILSYAANSRYVGYLDDDNWYAPDHVASMRRAIEGRPWAFALRHFVDRSTGEYLCPDTWESLGPGRGIYARTEGFVDTNCYLIDAQACYDVFPEWAVTRSVGGTGGDRQVFVRLAGRAWGSNHAHTVFYRVPLIGRHPYLLWQFRRAGVDLARFMPPEAIPTDDEWRQCADFDLAKTQRGHTARTDGGDGASRAFAYDDS
ncbi:MAG: hypothetical protein ACREX6_02840 [Casimicrobiaceae bacterium]